jgi:predicted transcriptional regulator
LKPRKIGLTDQELEIMKIVWDRESATVREVYEELLKGRKIAYTTVLTMMGILEQKGRLKKDAGERAYVYRPAEPRAEVVGTMVTDFISGCSMVLRRRCWFISPRIGRSVRSISMKSAAC